MVLETELELRTAVAAGLLASSATETEERTEPRTETRTAPPWNVIVHDDPITLMTYVTMVFRRVFGFPVSKAHRLMLEVHHSGRAVVWTGAKEQAEAYLAKLHAAQLLATIERVDA